MFGFELNSYLWWVHNVQVGHHYNFASSVSDLRSDSIGLLMHDGMRQYLEYEYCTTNPSRQHQFERRWQFRFMGYVRVNIFMIVSFSCLRQAALLHPCWWSFTLRASRVLWTMWYLTSLNKWYNNTRVTLLINISCWVDTNKIRFNLSNINGLNWHKYLIWPDLYNSLSYKHNL